jgi:hypothetical protein
LLAMTQIFNFFPAQELRCQAIRALDRSSWPTMGS